MPTLAAGASASISLTPGDKILLEGLGNAVAALTLPDGRVISQTLQVGAPKTLGPFDVTGSATLASSGGALTYSFVDYEAQAPGSSIPPAGWAKSQLASDVQASLTAADRVSQLPLGPILLLAKDNAPVIRASGNAGADNVYSVAKSFLLPGGSPGKNGTLYWDIESSMTSSAQTKEFALRIGGVLISPAWSVTTSASDQRAGRLHANNSQTAQKFRATTAIQGGSGQGYTATAIDLTVDQIVEVVCRWGAASVAGETITLESLHAWVEYGA